MTSCPQPAFIRYWAWVATVGPDGAILVDWQRVYQPDSVCLGPDAPGVPKQVPIGPLVDSEFKRLVVATGTVRVQPSDRTLVNFPNIFYTETVTYDLAPVTILGASVRITATPIRYDWYFGDGTSKPDGGAGARGTESVVHTYRRPGSVGPYVVIVWSGTYRVNGGPVQQVNGTAATTGAPTPLAVEQARSELVDG